MGETAGEARGVQSGRDGGATLAKSLFKVSRTEPDQAEAAGRAESSSAPKACLRSREPRGDKAKTAKKAECVSGT